MKVQYVKMRFFKIHDMVTSAEFGSV